MRLKQLENSLQGSETVGPAQLKELWIFLDDPNPWIRERTGTALGTHKGKETLELILRYKNIEEGKNRHTEAVRALCLRTDAAAKDSILELIDTSNTVSAIKALAANSGVTFE